jgi:hypothetical protein
MLRSLRAPESIMVLHEPKTTRVGRSRVPSTSVAQFAVTCLLVAPSCSPERSDAPATAPTSSAVAPVPPPTSAVATSTAGLANPLGLPPKKPSIAVGARVFAPPQTMLRSIELGASLAMRATNVLGIDDRGILLEGRELSDYLAHPSYVLAPEYGARPKPDQPVLAEWAGSLRHGAARRIVRDRVIVRFTDGGDRSERSVPIEQVAMWREGFQPGSFAITQDAERAHVMLVSRLGEGEDVPEWLALGWAGSTRRLRQDSLVAVPTRFSPKVGAQVWAEHLGRMREGIVREVDEPGVYRVKFERAGGLVEVGWGQIMPPREG